jgi:hypothetical protein
MCIWNAGHLCALWRFLQQAADDEDDDVTTSTFSEVTEGDWNEETPRKKPVEVIMQYYFRL